MIQMIPLKCPTCNADLEVEKGKEYYFCSYCGSKIMIHDTNKKIVEHIERNEADIEKAKAIYKKLENEDVINKRNCFLVLGIWGFIIVIILIQLLLY